MSENERVMPDCRRQLELPGLPETDVVDALLGSSATLSLTFLPIVAFPCVELCDTVGGRFTTV